MFSTLLKSLPMQSYQHEFLSFAIDVGVLRFGEFTLKSGRVSPYFFNAGLFNTGNALQQLGRYYAHTAQHRFDGEFMLFGPAYKGIPLAAATAIGFATEFGRDLAFAFDRKESKDHGEGGRIVGAPLAGRVLVVDDVITAGLSIDHSMSLIRSAGAEPRGVVIALDRQEQAQNSAQSAVQSVVQRYNVDVEAIATLDTLVEFLAASPQHNTHLDAIVDYRQRYGAIPTA